MKKMELTDNLNKTRRKKAVFVKMRLATLKEHERQENHIPFADVISFNKVKQKTR